MIYSYFYFSTKKGKSSYKTYTGCLKKNTTEIQQVCTTNVAKQFDFYIGRKSCYVDEYVAISHRYDLK